MRSNMYDSLCVKSRVIELDALNTVSPSYVFKSILGYDRNL